MIRITDESMCTGCTACVSVCPLQCIVMCRDRDGFDYPVANPDICIGCGKCDEVCPVANPLNQAGFAGAYAAKVPEYVSESSSGGVFPYLARMVVDKGGVVFGAVLESDMSVGHAMAETMSEVYRMRGAKYVQSKLYSVYEDVRNCLSDGRTVLFSGTPCQTAGLKSYLGKDYPNLITVDLACHGVPSPGLWAEYVNAMERKCQGRITEVRFRDKSQGWMHYMFTASGEGGKYSVPYMGDPYMALFVQNMTLRPSCYSCTARCGRSGSDITLADMWTVGHLLENMDDDKGTSLIVVRTSKGKEILAGMDAVEVPLDAAVVGNGGFSGTVKVPERREEFFLGRAFAKDLISYMNGYVVRHPFHVRMYRKVRSALSRLKRRIVR